MTTASEGRWRAGTADGFVASVRRTLDKPLTSYHLVLGVSGAAAVARPADGAERIERHVAQRLRQLVHDLLQAGDVGRRGLPAAFIASRLSVKLVRFLAWPALLFSVALIVSTYVPGFGVAVNGNQNWVSFGGPVQLQPSEFAKLALVLWCADVYARKGKLLQQWRHLFIPMIPVSLAGHRTRGRPARPRNGARPVRDRARHALGGRCAGAAVRRCGARCSACSPSGSPRWRRSGSPGSRRSSTRSTTTSARAGRPATASSHSPPVGSGGAASARATRSGATSPVRTPTTSSRSSARSSACSAAWWCSALFVTLAYCRHPDRDAHQGAVRQVRVGRHRGLAAEPGRHQRRAWCSACCRSSASRCR